MKIETSFLISLFHHVIFGFNLDDRIPIIKKGPGVSTAYFGYSVAQHITNSGIPFLLVGAPRDDNYQPETSGSGALWKCPITTNYHDCTQVETDGKRSSDPKTYGIFDGSIDTLESPVNFEIKDGQWLGVQVQSQGIGGHVIVCAHRYTIRDVNKNITLDNKRGMLGMCYILQSDLTLPRNDMVGFKNVMTIRDVLNGRRLDPKPSFDDHSLWGVCQLGTSAAFVSTTDIDDEDIVVLGAPGCFTWRGNIYGNYINSSKRYKAALNQESYTEYTKHGTLGMSVSSGNYFKDGKVYIVSGAPNAGDGGSVFFFQKDSLYNFLPDWNKTLHGKFLGAGFGYALSSLDTNGDGLSDLIVGSPFLNSGVVFLYSYDLRGLRRTLSIVGEKSRSQFGIAITSLKDLNHDGYEDFAIGAPYETDVGGSVYVFLGGPSGLRTFDPTSSKQSFKASSVSDQILTGFQMQNKMSGGGQGVLAFGSSLSGGMDMDGNGYPDLLIGSYESNHVFLIRSRPILELVTYVNDTNLKGINPGKSGCPEDPSASESCFLFSTCFHMYNDDDDKIDTHDDKKNGKYFQSDESLELHFNIVAEPSKLMSRVTLRLLQREISVKSSQLNDSFIFEHKTHCTDILGYVAGSSLSGNFQSPLEFSMTYSLNLKEPEEETRYQINSSFLPPPMHYFPILNVAEAKKTFWATFDKDCGSNELCESLIEVKGTLWSKKLNEEKAKALNYENGFYSLDIDGESEVYLTVSLTSLGDPAYETTLNVYFPSDSLSYVGLTSDSKLKDPDIKNSSWLSFHAGNPFKTLPGMNGSETTLRFRPHDVIDKKLIEFSLNVTTSSILLNVPFSSLHVLIVKRAEVKIIGGGFPSLVTYGGQDASSMGESAMRELSEIGPQIIHKYLVLNGGPSTIDVLTVRIQWPIQVENGMTEGKWLLYLTESPVLKNGKGLCSLPPSFPLSNPLNISYDRVKRHVEWFGDSIISPNKYNDYSTVVIFDCDRGTAKCVTISCQIYDLKGGDSSTIEIRSRLWNSTLVQDYNDIDSPQFLIEIYSKGKLEVDDDIIQNIGDDYTVIKTIAERLFVETLENKLRWWILLVAILLGILLLLLISLILWKFGFFKRRRRRHESFDETDEDFYMSAQLEKSPYR